MVRRITLALHTSAILISILRTLYTGYRSVAAVMVRVGLNGSSPYQGGPSSSEFYEVLALKITFVDKTNVNHYSYLYRYE